MATATLALSRRFHLTKLCVHRSRNGIPQNISAIVRDRTHHPDLDLCQQTTKASRQQEKLALLEQALLETLTLTVGFDTSRLPTEGLPVTLIFVFMRSIKLRDIHERVRNDLLLNRPRPLERRVDISGNFQQRYSLKYQPHHLEKSVR